MSADCPLAAISEHMRHFRVFEGFPMPAGRNVASSTEGRRRKAAREGTRGGRARRWGLWGFDGCRRSGAAQGTGLMEARDGLVGRGMATGVAQRAVLRAQAGRCRCDWRSGVNRHGMGTQDWSAPLGPDRIRPLF